MERWKRWGRRGKERMRTVGGVYRRTARKVGMYGAVRQFAKNGQWWSNPALHTPHCVQCLVLAGFHLPPHLPL